MSRIKVFRVEDNNGRGMYAGAEGLSSVSEMFEPCTHPNPRMDDKLFEAIAHSLGCFDILKHHNFGFESAKQLLRWVYRRDWWEDLSKAGFMVSVFMAEGWQGNTQVVFDAGTREPNLDRVSLLAISEYV